ncbi:M90 metallopeptidase family protein [Tuwongella immobilis]|uniref:Metallopeptidase n=1 Tax=Tuwongella immobilis TaxID=692036 RepID=A0A6C2YNV2_9BACT|nr:zinc-dependent peptidase [Tuwongella immobilis]VIP03047.1 metallopeptidase : Uncharacterized protein OS=Pirellula staleyi (strain ATCC 27377 / DSM 6068 / ICPB 4128) GN=Psta_2311 PE=4 SV=1: Peptidase_M90 [Tuwongella immobilis]VTS03228.1 metallopeptidase : Uncharacterized protein OS=Pirellula staleyi (strain ATCC 27377 / DSM 6068 / ICPB 4128) GN=Psta_2311 PE=4 SV=1: Peptidase_M90 [Tuwongella immobilis]
MRIPHVCGLILYALFFPNLVVAEAPAKPTSHTTRKIEGWTVRIDDRLLDGPDSQIGTEAIRLLEGQLHTIRFVVPTDRVKQLQRVTIQLDATYDTLRPAQYHPSVDWLAGKGYDRNLARCVHIPNARDFANPRHHREQPFVLMHELAHAYHDQVLNFDNPKIAAAFQEFRKKPAYQKTLHINGSRTRHYALTNPKEFFAEMTESYFGQNDFYPFNSAELKEGEPELFELLESIWGKLP